LLKMKLTHFVTAAQRDNSALVQQSNVRVSQSKRNTFEREDSGLTNSTYIITLNISNQKF
jgi:hypothetical protein